MKLKDFLNLPFLKTPSERNDHDDFYHHILNNFVEFEKNLKQVKNFQIENQLQLDGTDNIELIYNKANRLKNTIIKTLQLYYDGQPSNAYLEFKNRIEKDNLANQNFNFTWVKITDKLFRIRTSKNGHNFEPPGLFHIPMTHREVISTQRFSIPGHPCLYLSNSTFLCWLELGKPDIKECHASFFQVINDPNSFEELVLLDLTNIHPKLLKIAEETDPKWDKSVYRYLSLWPLIFATSVKVKYKEKYFKPEYIIPQLLLQYVKNVKPSGKNKIQKIHSIKYSSTHYDIYTSTSNYYNLAIPIHGSANEPYCNFLTQKFKLTDPVSLKQLIQSHPDMDNNFEKIDQYLEGRELKQINVNGEIITS